ncbi:hypothetical protein CAP48_11665 [Advenella sp. S44]|uniref:monovalent cation/H(+) antiporter subunit G n=1 Tax=Advenella sp. S44 TaxID=1982755 RepID=UPI000C29CABF|nr:monovalent cation/H(+) antiporter subunit G [Advenella sp. S44]PJX23737.1 hypothetical protein CAP48_11665 [Advenella sp. S44]
MMETLSPFIVIPAAILMVLSGLLVLTASIGMVRVNSFLPRTHIQAVIYSTALWCLLLASLLLTFSLKDRTFLHEILIGVFVFITSPISTILLVRSFVLREERAGVSDSKATTARMPGADAREQQEEQAAAEDVASIEAALDDSDQGQDEGRDQNPSRESGQNAGQDTDQNAEQNHGHNQNKDQSQDKGQDQSKN